RDEGAVLLVEWGAPYVLELGGDALVMTLSLEPRRAQLSATGPRGAALLAALAEGVERLDSSARAGKGGLKASQEESSTVALGAGLSVLLAPVLGWFEQIGATLVLTGETLLWTIRPPYRLGQLLTAMDFIGVKSIFIVSLTGVF